ncbi:LPD7 domain-containing protein [Aliivibrio fischeri]|uniref:LPD7 domain-containing protein n=2 Tax=Aliivibrio fischeri TaxID=668 RepID=UPI0007C4C62E|nr:LPD7 domain-containing protein [Aliivibrio fischeri]MCE7575561.1 relaxase [Aliivibrio fischeri]
MLIRVGGGNAGIGDYLKHGIKNGREHTRDELDHRVILEGNLEATELIINGMNTNAERYLHITLSFKEDHIDNETLSNITSEFKSFAMKAYNEDEYDFYAEAHIPKIKSVVDKKTKDLIERKPHIHVVIPKQNLVTNKRLDPFEIVEHNQSYIDAFQEVINEKYGLASPKMNIRSDFTNESTVIERSKGDTFKGANKAIKEKILTQVMAMPSSSLNELSDYLIEQGYEVKERNKGKENNYLNIKERGKSKGINLNDAVFSERFLSLSIDQKQHNLSHSSTDDYIAPEQGKYQATKKHHTDLEHWNEHRSHEVRHIKFRNRSAYKAMTKAEKVAFIQQKKKAFLNDEHIIPRRTQRDCVEDINRNLSAAKRHLSDAQRNCGNIESGARNIAYRRDLLALNAAIQRCTGHQKPSEPIPDRITGHSRVTQQIQSDIIENEIAKRISSDIATIKKSINASDLLRDLSQSHGVIPKKYVITQAKDGSDRIVCGTRQLNVADFLTKEIGMSWKEAKQQLEQSFARQQGHNLQPSTEHDREDFTLRWQPSHKKERKQAWKAQYNNEKAYRFAIKKTFNLEKNAIYADQTLSKKERNIALSIARMNKIISDMEYLEQQAWERNQLNTHYPDLVTAQYQRFEHRHIPIESEIMNNHINGTIEAHGSDHYEFNKENKKSYYVKLKLPNNQIKTVWGVGLETAIKESNVSIGQAISLKNIGKKNVTVPSDIKDENGKILKTVDVDTHRNHWEITPERTVQDDINQAISLYNESISLSNKGLEDQADDKEHDALMLMYSITKESKENPFNERTHPLLHRMFIKVNSEKMIEPEKEISPILKDNTKPKPISITLLDKRVLLDRNLEASRLLIMYPKLKELGISAEHISKTDKGDRIYFNDKSLTISKLMKETMQYKTKQIVAELTPIYETQEKDKQRVIEYQKRYLNDPSNKIDLGKEKTIELNIRSGQKEPEIINEADKERTQQASLAPQNYDDITHQTNEKGHVTYSMNKEPIVIDRGDNVHIAHDSDKAIEIGLRLSIEKFGKTLDIRGTDEYKAKVVEVAVKNNLKVQFSDPTLNEMMKEKTQQFRDGENVIQKAERQYKKDNEPQKSHDLDKEKSHDHNR